MLKLLLFFALLFIGTEAKLQVWHRKGCPLVKDLKDPLSEIVARNFNFSAYYFIGQIVSFLRMMVKAIVFRNDTNEQAIAVMKFQTKRNGDYAYFFVLLENCVTSKQNDKVENKRFSFELNISTLTSLKTYDTLNQAKKAAEEFEGKGTWAVTSKSNPADGKVKTNKERNVGIAAKTVAGIVFSPIVLFACLVFCLKYEPTPPNYAWLKRHWNKRHWEANKDFKIKEYKGEVFIIDGAVYENASE